MVELDQYYDDVSKSKADYTRHKKREENDRVYMFLAGVNRRLDEAKGRILRRRPLPSIREVFSEIRLEESRKKVMNSRGEVHAEEDSSALVSRNANQGKNQNGSNQTGGDQKKKQWCDHCKMYWHTQETCWKIHGKPPGWKKRSEKALQTVGENSQEAQINSGQLPFTKDQIDQLVKLLQSSSNLSSTSSGCSFAQHGKFPVVSFTCSNSNCTWIIDSGATDHMTGSSSLFSSYKPCAGNRKVKIADGSLSPIAGTGDVKLSTSLTLSNVLHVPKLSCNLISISKLTQDLNCQAKFFHSHCEFQDTASGKMIGNARECGGLYILDEESNSSKIDQENSCLKTTLVNKDNEIYLWHFRLGHPSFFYMKQLFPKLFKNKNPSNFQCEICALAKHHRASYSHRLYRPSKPFSLIHTDLWGLSRVTGCFGKR